MHHTAIHIAIGTLILMILTVRVLVQRIARRIEIGDNGDKAFFRYTRVHANFLEYTPMMLLLLAGFESLGGSAVIIHLAGGSFFSGRIAHAIGMSRGIPGLKIRQAGMVLTMVSMTTLSLIVIGKYAQLI